MIALSRFVTIASIAFLTAGLLSSSAKHANAQASDPAGDFLPSYIGPQNGDLDVLSTGALYDGTNFRFFATLNGNVGTTNGAFYVWGVDRGAGTVGFPTLAPGVTFDTVVIARTSLVTPTNASLATGTAAGNALAANSISFTGNTISVLVPASFLPSTGKPLSQYTINLWPRFGGTFNGVNVTGLAAISDFAPNNSNVAVTVAPEPGSLALVVVGGISSIGLLQKRRRNL